MPAAASRSSASPRFVPRLTLQTLGRGDGLLGLAPAGPFGPRGPQVTLAFVDWTYVFDDGAVAAWPAPVSVLAPRGAEVVDAVDDAGRPVRVVRDRRAEADAMDRVWDLGLLPVDPSNLQWRGPALVPDGAAAWSLDQEAKFGDLWADAVPSLSAAGWRVVARPGFAHLSVAVSAWRVVVDRATGETLGHEVAGPLAVPGAASLRQPLREGSFLLSLGIEIDGEVWDLAPLLWDLLRREPRWLDPEELASIADTAKVRLRAPGGRRIEATAGPIKAILGAMLDLLTEPRPPQGPLRLNDWDLHRVERLVAGGLLQGDADVRALVERIARHDEPLTVPDPGGLGLALRDYQRRGVAWLQHLRAMNLAGVLADDMGLGKTAQALAHLLIEREAGRLAGAPALVVVPTSLLFNWQAEAARVAPDLRVLVLHGADRQQRFAEVAQHDLVLTTYPLVWRDLAALQSVRFHVLLLDEAQTVKNPTGRAPLALRRLHANHRLCLTGTPIENHLGELWAQFDFLMPGFLGDRASFWRRWRKPIEENGEVQRAELLRARVRPFILRRRKDDVLPELPPKTEVIEHVVLEGPQRALYESVRVASDELVRRVLQRQGFGGGLITILDALLKLRQVCNDPQLLRQRKVRAAGSAKRERLRELLPTLVAEGRRVLVFSQFTAMLALVQRDLDELGLPWLALTGDTPPAERGGVVASFQAGASPLLLLSLKAGGVGLNLTAADTVVHIDPWWNPAVERQATDRAHRIGQDKPVFVHKLIVAGSIEERILALQARKGALAEGVLGDDAGLAEKFSPQDLAALLAPLSDAGFNPA